MRLISRSMRIPRMILGVALIAASSTLCHGFGKTFDPIIFTREARLIFVAKIVELRAQSVVAEPSQFLKGAYTGRQIQLPWEREKKWEFVPAEYRAGETLLVFAQSTGSVFEPVGGPEGTLDLDSPKHSATLEIVRNIVLFDAVTDTDTKKNILAGMLNSKERAIQLAGLHAISFGTPIPPKAFAGPISRLLKSADHQLAGNAVSLIAEAGDKSDVPAVIELLASPHAHVARSAHDTLVHWTGANIPVDLKKSPAERKKSIGDWTDWWTKNKEKVKLRR